MSHLNRPNGHPRVCPEQPLPLLLTPVENLFLRFSLLLATFPYFLKKSQRVPPADGGLMEDGIQMQGSPPPAGTHLTVLGTKCPPGVLWKTKAPEDVFLKGYCRHLTSSKRQNDSTALKAFYLREALICRCPAQPYSPSQKVHWELRAWGQGLRGGPGAGGLGVSRFLLGPKSTPEPRGFSSGELLLTDSSNDRTNAQEIETPSGRTKYFSWTGKWSVLPDSFQF